MKKWLVMMLFIYAPVYAGHCTGVQQYCIYDTAARAEITYPQLADALNRADIVLIGEQHTDERHHRLETALVQSRSGTPSGSLLLEMLDSDQAQPVRDTQAWLAAGGKTLPGRLPEKIAWNESWQWDNYQALMWAALNRPAAVLPANPPRRDVLKMKDFRPAGANAARAEVKTALGKIMAGNHGSTEGMVAMQQYKDSVMAQNLLTAPKPAWLIAGAVHTAKDLGVPLFLRDAAYSGSLKTVIFSDEGSGLDGSHADYIVYFPVQAQPAASAH